jgi:hypothetical protein
MGAVTSLNISNNNRFGWLSVSDGWETKESVNAGGYQTFRCPSSRLSDWHKDAPPAAKAEGIIAIADVIPYMRALSSLNLAKTSLSKDGALAICDALLGSSRYTNSMKSTPN